MSQLPRNKKQHVNIFGVGAGPANLSLAALLYHKPQFSNLFVDQKNEFSWHDNQLIDGATLQVSIFKDLVTLSDPTSIFTFLSYLHEKGRIYHFLNAQFDKIPRREFRNYMAWAAEKNENVVFGEKVLNIDFDGVFQIETNKRNLSADHISIGVGTQPWVPEFVNPWLGESQYHISQYMKKGNNVAGKRVIIVGGGQSGAEVFLDLFSKPANQRPAHISWISRRRNFFPIDDSAFTNDFYMPCYSDYFSQLSCEMRKRTNAENLLTSDGISESTLRAIYQKLYYNRFVEQQGITFNLLPNRSVSRVKPAGDENCSWVLDYSHNDANIPQQIDADIVIWATGYQATGKSFLGALQQRIQLENGEFVIDDDFAVSWDGPAKNHLFVQNAARGQRGLPDVNLSLNAWRAQRIVGRLTGHYPIKQVSSFIEWAVEKEIPQQNKIQGMVHEPQIEMVKS